MTMFSGKLKRTALRQLAFDAGVNLQSNIKEYFATEMSRSVARLEELEMDRMMERKRKVLTATARAVSCSALPQADFGHLILLHLLIHDDKKIDNIIKLFFNTIRKQNSPAIESRIVFKALKEVRFTFFKSLVKILDSI